MASILLYLLQYLLNSLLLRSFVILSTHLFLCFFVFGFLAVVCTVIHSKLLTWPAQLIRVLFMVSTVDTLGLWLAALRVDGPRLGTLVR